MIASARYEASLRPYSNSLRDKPVETGKYDRLPHTIRYVEPVVKSVKESDICGTIAICGEWGCGKSSVINLIEEEIKKDKKIVVIKFDIFIEQAYEIAEMMQCFYAKLCAYDGSLKKLAKPII